VEVSNSHNILSYHDQLLNEEWKNKRLEILKRDEYKCQHCQNLKIVKICNPGLITMSFQNQSCSLLDLKTLTSNSASLYDKTYKHIPEHSKICFYHQENGKKVVFGYLENLIPVNRNIAVTSLDEDSEETINFWNAYYRVDQARLILQNIKPEMFDWQYVFNMHIHHKYYQKGLLAWEYPDAALITLCWDCHEELHKNATVPELDENGNQIRLLTCCPKCHGAGWLPQYKHVENGICFKCDGRRFTNFVKV
jgi:5-methylcytosine-specific restriction endonuclease McrA